MKVVTIGVKGVQTLNSQGNPIETNGAKKAIIHTVDNKTIWCPLAAVKDGANTVTYKLNEKGDTFVADRDSKTMHPVGTPEAGNPLYLKGDVVTRTADFPEFISMGTEEVFTQAAMDKMTFAAKLGLAVHI